MRYFVKFIHHLFLQRYINIIPFDNNLVKIKAKDGFDYINASWIELEGKTNMKKVSETQNKSKYEKFMFLYRWKR